MAAEEQRKIKDRVASPWSRHKLRKENRRCRVSSCIYTKGPSPEYPGRQGYATPQISVTLSQSCWQYPRVTRYARTCLRHRAT
ncbi:hypothetical protein NPIL_1281 [Nephila pilipes]|uniref:Uncharacterized protein n=1 Tax=Nephila pilipes TaxID=299642 RepID=A0A8X6N7R7_NEPPI|nr:hypothetical protein NPIL_1281 [Nephila pilipes]